MHRLVPQFIQEQYAAGQLTGDLVAFTLFVDISGFTPITDAIMGHGQHGAEVLAGIIQEVFNPLVQSVFEYGGFVTNFAGDAFTAVFPAGDNSADTMRQALAAAWQMQQVMATAADHQTPYGTFTLSVKVGLSYGELSWGIVSSPANKRAAYYFQGPAIDGSAKAQQQARAGQVIVDAAVHRAAGSIITVKPVADHFQVTTISGKLPDPQPVNLSPILPEIVNRFFPPEASQQEVSGELRPVASMFVGLPTVRVGEQLEAFLQIIFELQDRYGGMLNRLDYGDKGANILLFWGAPTAHENDVFRALSLILDLQSKTVIPVSAGLSYGIAHSGYSGGSLAGEYTCHGRGTTLAARLMQAAPRGEVWIDEQVADIARRNFEVEFEDALAFKGFAGQQMVYVLLERKETAEVFFEGQLIGRQEEQAQMVRFIEPLWQGLPAGALLVLGDPGIGKSRLVDAFLSSQIESADIEFNIFKCQTDEILRESLNPFRYWLRRYLGQSEQQSDARNKRSFSRKLDRLIARTHDERLAAELDRTRSFLGALVNLHWPDSLYEQLDAQGRYVNTFSALVTLLKVESQHKPIVLLLEDVHWLDEDSQAFLQELQQALAGGQQYPIAILATARPEGYGVALGQGIDFQELTLNQITPADQALLAADQLGGPVGEDVRQLLVDRAEGNPFFTEQILRYMQEQDLLLRQAGQWHLKVKNETALPTDVQTVLVARLDRLTQYVREVVQTASVLGREFEVRLLARMLGDDPGLEEKIAEAEQMAIWTALGELRYMFKHSLLRDAAYRMQVRSRRQTLHELAAEAMEKVYADHLEPHYGELAYHAEQAHQITKACHYLGLAGDTAKDAYQNSMALDYYARAMNLTAEEYVEDRYKLLATSESLHERLGGRQEQLDDLTEMWSLAESLGDVSKKVQVKVRRAWVYWWQADFDLSLATSQEASSMAKAAGREELGATADHASAWAMIQREDYANARRLTENALTSSRQSGNKRMEASAFQTLGFIYRNEGDYYAGLRAVEQALRMYQDIGTLHNIGRSVGNLGVANMTLGNYPAAKDYFLQGLAINREIGARANSASDLINLAWYAEAVGEWESAISYAEEGLTILRSVVQHEMIAEGLIWLGHARMGAGQLEQALAAYRESLELRRQLGQEYQAMGVLAGMARAALKQDALDSAVDQVAQIMAYLDSGGSLDGTWEPLRVYLTCYQVLQAAGDGRADGVLEVAYQKLWKWARMIPDDEIRHMYLEAVPWHREITAAYRTKGLENPAP